LIAWRLNLRNIPLLASFTVILISNLSYNLVLDLFRFAGMNAMVQLMLKRGGFNASSSALLG
jgi:hypothetical protein